VTPLTLTREGVIFHDSITSLLNQYADLEQTIHDFSLLRNFVRVGFATLFGNRVFADILAEYRRRFPEIKVVTEEGSYGYLMDKLEEGRLDLALCSFPEQAYGTKFEADSLAVARVGLKFCVNVNHPYAWRKQVSWAEAAAVPLVLLNERFNLGKWLTAQFNARGLKPDILHMTDQVYTVERFIENNIACGFLPEDVAVNNRYIACLELEEGLETKLMKLYWSRKSGKVPAVQHFVECTADYVQKNQLLLKAPKEE